MNLLNKVLFQICAFSLFVGFTLPVCAQKLQEYTGPYTVNGYQGNANFSYMLKDGDTVFQGPFMLKRSSLDALLEKEDESFTIKGNFSAGVPTGRWTFSFGAFNSNKQTEVEDYQYRVLVSGLQEEVSGDFLEGKLQGNWIYKVSKIKDSEIEEERYSSSIGYEAGLPIKDFSIANSTSTLVGRFLRDGIAHDNWELFSAAGAGTEESWIFENGLLLKVIQKEGNTSNVFPVFENNTAETEIIDLNTGYLNLVNLTQKNADADFSKGLMQRLLAENANRYQKINNFFLALNYDGFKPKFKVKAPYFPLEKSDIDYIEQAIETASTYKPTLDSLLSNAHLNILKRTDDNVYFQYNVLSYLNENFIEPFSELKTLNETGIIDNLSVTQLYASLWKNGAPKVPFEVKATTKDKTVVKEFQPESYELQTIALNSYKGFSQMAEFTAISITEINKKLQRLIREEKGEQQLLAIEDQWLKQQEAILLVKDSLEQYGNNNQKRALTAIQELLETNLGVYANLETIADKKTFAEDQITCTETLLQIANQISKLPENVKTIEEAYLDPIWNPFMATVMNEEIKKRITSAYKKVLVPYFYKQSQQELNCENAAALHTQMTFAYNRMLQLRNLDTHKLERKLKREKNPEKVLQLFEEVNTKKSK
ncbi:hypothetical protein BUL40_05150 [Croceivirga radicis]|uniref:Uncharacterized protein n=1 Tax=Croceivirga radicis TaxID=1929488 RepID=A0A1V6LT53_9FLAO|nr:hypothetical protein [Croceivirga radicis]OQD43227.1 hypothetical protein BUL40_05150 [Croceivirga radicis]